jgi:hypothetical protein
VKRTEFEMTKVLQWLTRGKFILGGTASAVELENVMSFERIDGAALPMGGFRASGSMDLIDARVRDFSETLPAYAHSADAVLWARTHREARVRG